MASFFVGDSLTKTGLSIKYKLLILLIILPILTLGVYLVLAIRLFESDKIAYVFDSSAAVAKTLASEMHAEINSSFSAVKPILEGLDFEKNEFDQTARNIFRKENGLKWISIYRPETEDPSGPSTKIVALHKDSYRDDTPAGQQLASKACRQNLALSAGRTPEEVKAGLWLIGICQGEATRKYAAVFLIESAASYDAFIKNGIHHNYLIEKEGRQVLGPDFESPKNFLGWRLLESLVQKDLPLETQEMKTPEGGNVIASYARVGQGNLYVISFIDRAIALQAVKVLLRKSVLFLVAIVLLAIIISVIASSSLTATLQELAAATQTVADGDFVINLDVRSNDEVGTLARNFNKMAREVSRLMSENIKKARMEKELETAKTVQETLLPPPDFNAPGIKISGAYEPASECGGDWWHYCEKDSKILLWIGDVTGHGAPAAMITSAAKSASTIIETSLPSISPAEVLQILNRAVFHTSKGQIQMTFFVASFDRATGELTYANASHDIPYLIKQKQSALTLQDFTPLNEANSPRLGEALNSSYEKASIILQSGDLLLFYTDGVIDLNNPSGKPWGERSFLKSVMASYTSGIDPQDLIAGIKKTADDFRSGADLVDDITFFACKYENPV